MSPAAIPDNEIVAALAGMISEAFAVVSAQEDGEYALLTLRRRRPAGERLVWRASRGGMSAAAGADDRPVGRLGASASTAGIRDDEDGRLGGPVDDSLPSADPQPPQRLMPALDLRIPLPSSLRRKPFLIEEPRDAQHWVALFQARLEEAFARIWEQDDGHVDLGQRRTIRVFPDYCADWPLWENSSILFSYGYTMAPADYGLSLQLTGRLVEWQRFWELHQDVDRDPDWDSEVNHRGWLIEGERIAAALAAEVDAIADVSYEAGTLGC